MAKLAGYMITWTTYGSWPPGDERGYVRKGNIYSANDKLKEASRRQQKHPTVSLSPQERQIVRGTTLLEGQGIGQTIRAVAVCANHVHIVAEPCRQSIEQVVSRYKNKAMFELRKLGRNGRIWTRGFDKRFCFSGAALQNKTNYVNKHNV
jgi:hypothetical protein